MMKKAKIYVESKGVGDVIYDELRNILANDNVLFRLATLVRIPATSTITINNKKLRKEKVK